MSHIETANPDYPFRRPHLPKHHANCGALARAIVAQQPENLSRRHRQVQILNGLPFAKPFRHITKFNHRKLIFAHTRALELSFGVSLKFEFWSLRFFSWS